MTHCEICGLEGAHGCMGMQHWLECPSRKGGECVCGFDERKAAYDALQYGRLREITEERERRGGEGG